jgi:hypothetical protein
MGAMIHRLYPVCAIAVVTVLAACGPYDDGYADDAYADDEAGEGVSDMSAHPGFRLGLQASGNGCSRRIGTRNFSDVAESTTVTWTRWTSDSNRYDPDCLRITLRAPHAGDMPTLDFRLMIQASDAHPGGHAGFVRHTPWASEGGGVSGLATDDNRYDPDYFRVGIETRPWPKTRRGAPQPGISDFRAGLRAIDLNGGDVSGREVFTPSARAGGGTSPWARDSNAFNPDGYTIHLDVK